MLINSTSLCLPFLIIPPLLLIRLLLCKLSTFHTTIFDSPQTWHHRLRGYGKSSQIQLSQLKNKLCLNLQTFWVLFKWLTGVAYWTNSLESDVGVAKSKGGVSGWRDFGFNLCVVPFPNVYVLNFKLEDLCLSCLELFGVVQRSFGVVRGVRGSEVCVRYWITDGSSTKLVPHHPFYYAFSNLKSVLFPSHLWHPSIHPCSPCFILCPCIPVSLISVPMPPWSSCPLHMVFSLHSCFLCFTLVPLFLVPDWVKLTLQCRVS